MLSAPHPFRSPIQQQPSQSLLSEQRLNHTTLHPIVTLSTRGRNPSHHTHHTYTAMSEVASRPAPARGGRGAGRGGRGGARGSTRGRDRPTNGTYKDSAADDFADQGELGEMKKQYSSQLPMLKELFQDWTDVDLLFALQETDGDLTSTIERISEGTSCSSR